MIEHLFVRGVIPLLMMCLAGCAGSVPTADPGGQPPGSPPLHAEESPPSPTASTLPEPVVPSAAAQSVFTISMPVYRQVMNLDCEAAALQMALASLGHPYSQPALFAEENADPRLPIITPTGASRIGGIHMWGSWATSTAATWRPRAMACITRSSLPSLARTEPPTPPVARDCRRPTCTWRSKPAARLWSGWRPDGSGWDIR